MSILSDEQIEQLKQIDTPTLCNAIESFNVRGRVDGFLGMDIACLSPELGTMVGYAVTVKVDSTTPDIKRDDEVWREWVLAMDRSPKPVVLVFEDVGPQPKKSAHIGEMMATLAQRLGAVGLVTNGGVRDMLEVRALGFHYFAPGIVASHGNPRLLEVNVPVTIDGVQITPGDLLHGDLNGVTTIPLSIAAEVAEAAAKVRASEAEMLEYMRGPDFTVEGFFERRFRH
ncbi:MAG: RraA family protein [Anaerolineae bacterium]|nr:RraA family protein [Anaerolineae bacterium]